MSTATSVISTPPRGATFDGAPGRGAAADATQADGFAGLLFSRLEAAPGESAGPARRGETLPAGGDALPVAEDAGKVAVAGESPEGVAESAALEKREASGEVASVEAESTELESALEETELARSALARSELDKSELAKSELAKSELDKSELDKSELDKSELDKSELDRAADADIRQAEVALENAGRSAREQGEGDAPSGSFKGEVEGGSEVEAGLDEPSLATRVGAEAADGDAGVDETAVAAKSETVQVSSRAPAPQAGETARAAVDGLPPAQAAPVFPGTDAPPGDARESPPAQAEAGLARAGAVSAEASALHTVAMGAERSGEAAARTEPAPVRGQGADSGQSQAARAEGQTRALEAANNEGDTGREESDSRREREPGRSGEFVSQKDGALKAEIVLPSAKELTFENPFRGLGLGLGLGETGARAQGAGGAPAPSLVQLQQAYQGSATGATSLAVGERFGSAQWGGGVTQRILWMANQQVGRAELRLDPPELGSLTVRLNISQDQASVSFVSPHPHVREALEQQMPRLREMLAENGLNLQESDVSDQSPSRDSGDGRDEDGRGGGRGGKGGAAELEGRGETVMKASLGLVDFYA